MLSPISSLLSWRGVRCLLALGLLTGAAAAYAGEAARIVFVAGQVHSGGRALVVGEAVQEGDEIATGTQGYVYLKTVDNGLLILRPSSRARIVTYHVDKVNPANTQIKFELLSGVARSVSGEAVKLARQNFRFNTPVAAIGVRGTDFTVSTDADTSRVTVISGAIVVSGFGGNCLPGGSGPCEAGGSRELAASQIGQMLQVTKGKVAPQLLSTSGSTLAPDNVVPPRSDEPGKSGGNASTGDLSLDPKKTEAVLSQAAVKLTTNPPTNIATPPPVTPVVPPPVVQSEIIWGRWQAVAASKPATVDAVAALNAGAQEISRNSYYTVMRTPGEVWQSPAQGSIGFSLAQSDAYILNENTKVNTLASLENAKLNVNFGTAVFSTSFDVVSNSGRYLLQTEGTVSKDGILQGYGQFAPGSNMAVNGVLSNTAGGSAAYIFSSRLDDRRVINGVTYWRK